MILEELQNSEHNDIRLFAMTYPWVAEKTVKWFKEGEYYIFELDNGRFIEYDFLMNRYRSIMSPDEKIERTEMDFRTEFSFKLRRRMDMMNVTQTTLEQLTGINRRVIYRYVHGMAIPSAFNLEKIAYTLKCDIKDLI